MHTSVSLLSQTAVKDLVDTHIRFYCEERKGQALEVGERYGLFWDTIESLILAGGKRFRPYMIISAYAAYAQEAEVPDILPAAIAQELLHSAMLIHDDIIDRDTIRYGVKNIAGQYQSIYNAHAQDEVERDHLSLSAALLAGDILLSDAHRLLGNVNRPEELINRADEILSRGIFEVIGGELLDSEAAILPPGTIPAERIARYKTASYSFISPLTMGATLAGAPNDEVVLLAELARHLGIGYQLCDDLLGVFGDESQTGKSTSTDIREGKRTVIIEQFDTLATDQQKERFYQLFHRMDATDSEVEEARLLLIEVGAQSAVKSHIELLQNKAHDIVARLSVSEESKTVFYNLITQCLEREG